MKYLLSLRVILRVCLDLNEINIDRDFLRIRQVEKGENSRFRLTKLGLNHQKDHL